MKHLQSTDERRRAFCGATGPTTPDLYRADCIACLRVAIVEGFRPPPLPSAPSILNSMTNTLAAFLQGGTPPPTVPLWWCDKCKVGLTPQIAPNMQLFCPQCRQAMNARRANRHTGAVIIDAEVIQEIPAPTTTRLLPPGKETKK